MSFKLVQEGNSWHLTVDYDIKCALCEKALKRSSVAYFCKDQVKAWCVECFKKLKFDCGISYHQYIPRTAYDEFGNHVGKAPMHDDYKVIIEIKPVRLVEA